MRDEHGASLRNDNLPHNLRVTGNAASWCKAARYQTRFPGPRADLDRAVRTAFPGSPMMCASPGRGTTPGKRMPSDVINTPDRDAKVSALAGGCV